MRLKVYGRGWENYDLFSTFYFNYFLLLISTFCSFLLLFTDLYFLLLFATFCYICYVCYIFASSSTTSTLGFLLSYSLGITGKLSGLVSSFTETERELVSVERCVQAQHLCTKKYHEKC